MGGALTMDDRKRDLRVRSDAPFFVAMVALGASYVVLIVGLLVADATFASWDDIMTALGSEEVRYAIWLSLLSCTVSTVLSLWVAVPIGYLLSRFEFRGKSLVNAILDVPIVLPPLVIGISLLILFQLPPGRFIEDNVGRVTHMVPAVIIAQFAVACAFAVRTMIATFERIDPRREQVAMTLGCSRSRAFFSVVLPEARPGVLTAATLAWARALGEFGPIVVFAGTFRMRTEVMPTTIFLEFSVGNLEGATAVSLLMVTIAAVVLIVARRLGGGSVYA